MTSASDLRSGKTHRDENFPVASWIIHPRHRALILAFYNFVRTADDIADHADLPAEEKLRYLDLLEAELLGGGDTQAEAVRLRSVLAERGTWPIGLLDEYPADPGHLIEYARAARTDDGFRAYCDRFVHQRRAAAE